MKKQSFKKIKVIEVFCISCKKRFNSGFEFEDVFKSKKEAVESITDSGWGVKNGNAYCDDCFNYVKH